MSRQVDLGQIVPNIQVGTTTTGLPSTPASVENVGTDLNPIFNFTIPKGNTGATPNIQIGDVQTGDTSEVTITGTDENPILNFTLEKGDTGNGISSIAKTSTSGLVDTYTITFTNGQTTTYQITNGANGSVVDVQVDGTSVVDNGIANIIGLTQMKQELEDMYNLLPKVSGTGEVITLDNTVAGKMKINLKGNTSQETTTGINLLPNIPTQTLNDITITNNGDGSYTLNGTASANTYFDFYAGNFNSLQCVGYYLKEYNYSNVVGLFGISSEKPLSYRISTSNRIGIQGLSNINPIQIEDNGNDLYLALRINYGGVLNNVKIMPMLVSSDSSLTAEVEPYTGGNPAPNPSYPETINVVSGDNSINVCSKNLFDYDNATIKNDYAKDENGNEISSPGSNYTTSYTPVKPNTTYTFSYNLTSVASRIYFYDSNKNWISRTNNIIDSSKSYTFTTPNNCYYLQFLNVINYSTTKPMLNEGSTATTYEPYQSASYPINLGVENLIDLDRTQGTYSGNGTIFEESKYYPNMVGDSGNVGSNTEMVSYTSGVLTIKGRYQMGVGYPIKCKPNQDYYIKTTSNDSTARMFVSFYDSTGTYISGSPNNVDLERQVTSPSNAYWIIPIFAVYGTSLVSVPFSDIKVLEGTKEQYISTTPIELCKIGNYQDSIVKDNGKWYLNKQIGKVVLNGSEVIWNAKGTGGNNVYVYQWSRGPQDKLNSVNEPIYCNYFKQITISQSDAKNVEGIASGKVNEYSIKIGTTASTTVEDFQTWLSTNKPVVYYPLATPTTTEITDSTLISQLEVVKRSYNEQTNITQTNDDLPFILDVTALKELTQ